MPGTYGRLGAVPSHRSQFKFAGGSCPDAEATFKEPIADGGADDIEPCTQACALYGQVAAGPAASSLRAADEDGVAVAILYDTSGSMKQTVRDKTGGSSPKYVIANRALVAIARQIQTFTTNAASGSPARSAS